MMKGWQVALISLLTFVVGGGLGLAVGGFGGGAVGSLAGLMTGSCETGRAAVQQKLLTEKQASQLLATVVDNIAAKGDNTSNIEPQELEKAKQALQECLKTGSVKISQ